MLFYELFIKDSDGSLYPVPVRIANYYRQDGTQPNIGPDASNYNFTRRFFLYDNIGSVGGSYSPGKIPAYLRYA